MPCASSWRSSTRRTSSESSSSRSETKPGEGRGWALGVARGDGGGKVPEAAGDAVETRHRDWLKNHVRRIVHGIPKPGMETLLTDDQQVGVSEFILRHARRKGVGAGQLQSIER